MVPPDDAGRRGAGARHSPQARRRLLYARARHRGAAVRLRRGREGRPPGLRVREPHGGCPRVLTDQRPRAEHQDARGEPPGISGRVPEPLDRGLHDSHPRRGAGQGGPGERHGAGRAERVRLGDAGRGLRQEGPGPQLLPRKRQRSGGVGCVPLELLFRDGGLGVPSHGGGRGEGGVP
ncbi:unnamed protein product, partial [Ascophyllum nodosum]